MKIRNVPVDVCTAEQKIAYNLAFKISISLTRDYDQLSEHARKSYLNKVSKMEIDNLRLWSKKKYNYSEIEKALNKGLMSYLEHPFIADTYEEIGKAF